MGDFHDLRQHFFLRVENAVDEPLRQCLMGGHAAARIGQFAHQSFGHEFDDTRKCADIGGHADFGFVNGEKSVFGCITHIRRRHHVDTAADTSALNGDQHRQTALLHHRKTVLHALDRIEEFQPLLFFGMRLRRSLPIAGAEHGHVNAAAKMRAGRRNDDDAGFGFSVEAFDDLR